MTKNKDCSLSVQTIVTKFRTNHFSQKLFIQINY
jgi:hypothetical protein